MNLSFNVGLNEFIKKKIFFPNKFKNFKECLFNAVTIENGCAAARTQTLKWIL
jgi:hypothetical protein